MSLGGIPLSRIDDNPFATVRSDQTTLYEVTDRAKTYHDLSERVKKQELAFKIGLAVAAALVAIGTAIAIYYCMATSNAPMAFLSGVYGGVTVLCLIASTIAIDFDEESNGVHFSSSETVDHAECVDILTTADLNKIYDTYYKKNGGLRELVRKGYLTTGQADTLRGMLQEFETQKNKQGEYTSQPRVNSAIQEGNQDASKKIQELETQWRGIQNALRKQYDSQ